MTSHGHCISARSTANENRLLAAVTLLTYKNERLQQHSHRESIHVFSTKLGGGGWGGGGGGAAAQPSTLRRCLVHQVSKVDRGLQHILVKFVVAFKEIN